MGKHAQSIDTAVLRRIRRQGPGWVFAPADFLDLGSRTAVGLALMRHTRAGTVIQALRWLGQRHVDGTTVAILRRRLSPGDRRQVLKDLRYAPAWIGAVLRRIAEGDA